MKAYSGTVGCTRFIDEGFMDIINRGINITRRIYFLRINLELYAN